MKKSIFTQKRSFRRGIGGIIMYKFVTQLKFSLEQCKKLAQITNVAKHLRC